MQTRFLTSLTTTFNPLSPSTAHKIPRLILSRLPSSPIAATGSPLPVKTKLLQRGSLEPAKLVIGFKGGETLEFVEVTRKLPKGSKGAIAAAASGVPEAPSGVLDLGNLGLKDVLEEVERRCRVLGRKDQIAG